MMALNFNQKPPGLGSLNFTNLGRPQPPLGRRRHMSGRGKMTLIEIKQAK